MPRYDIANTIIRDGSVSRILIGTSNGDALFVMVDSSDVEELITLGRWVVLRLGGLRTPYTVNAHTRLLLHRILLNPCDDQVVDHINHDTLDCRRENLRICTHTENKQNRSGPTRSCKSGVRNVWWDPAQGKWRVVVKANLKRHHIGFFETLEEAGIAAAAARKRLHGEFAS